MEIKKIFDRPKIIAVVGDVNAGKSMLLYHLLELLARDNKFRLYSYGLRLKFQNAQQIFSVTEMEQIVNSLIIIDELSSLFDLDNRKVKKQIENSLRLINHNNNILVICGTPENFKKFLSAKVSIVFFKTTTIADFINGSRIKNILVGYKGNERGAEMLNLKVEESILFDGEHFEVIKIPYYDKYDTKAKNVPIFVPKNVPKNVPLSVRKNALKTFVKKNVQKTSSK